MNTSNKVIITVTEPAESYMEQLVCDMRSAGLKVDKIMADMGLVVGVLSSDCIDRIRDLEGVESVEDDTDMSAI